jgi:hypothetical protein
MIRQIPVITACFSLFCSVIAVAEIDSTGVLGFGKAAFTQEMQTDRPDFTEGPLTIQSGHFQLESGYTYSEASGGGVAHTFPESLFRFGIASGTELRLYWEGLVIQGADEPMGSRTSATDFSVGAKQRLFNPGEMGIFGKSAELSTIIELGIPVGSASETNGTLQPGGKLLFSQDLTDWLSLGKNLNAFVVEDGEADGRHYLEVASSASLAASLSDTWGAYLEHFAFYPFDTYSTTAVEHYVNGGFTYALNSNLQLDMRTGMGLSSTADDFFTGAGVSIRQ